MIAGTTMKIVMAYLIIVKQDYEDRSVPAA